MLFRHWLTDSAGLWSEKRESEPWGCLSLLPGGSFQRTSQGWGTQTELSGLAGLKRARSEMQEGTVARICETEPERWVLHWRRRKRERCTLHSSVYRQASLESLAEYRSAQAWEETTQFHYINELGDPFSEFTQGWE